ncbi:alpha/beta fold hydrolase [Salinicoccus albus]|uniref:alpha/beta fold hydrolase n=1 Tax=Salinicoccus albus TaxID=418756 RepID=UPI0003AAF0EE|nr:alpha/beta hydrolase [Salinicoccus albus]
MKRVIDRFVYRGKTMEFSVTGDGENPIMLLHGGHSNCHEVFGRDVLVNNGFTVIIPSRAGYGNTSRSIGNSMAEAAEYYIKLLNHLSVDEASIVAVSAGGPTGLYMAAKYPERVKSLTLQSAVTKEWYKTEDHLYKISQVIFRPPFERFTWKMLSGMNNIAPDFTFKMMFSAFSSLNYEEAADKISKSDVESVRKMNNRQRSGSGF